MPKGKAYRASILVTIPTILIIPNLTLAIEQRLAEAAQADVRAAQTQGGAAAGVRHGHTIPQPELDIRQPAQRAVDLDVCVVAIVMCPLPCRCGTGPGLV